MKKIFVLLCVLFTDIAVAEPINITWYNEDGTTYDTTTCNAGDTLVLPTTPTKRGYTFLGWATYTPLEYIESTGTQYIDTGYIGNLNTKIRVEFMNTQGSEDYNSAIICGDITSKNSAISVLIGSIRGRSSRFGSKEQEFALGYDFTDEKHSAEIDKYSLKVDDVSKIIFNESTDFSTESSIYLFTINNNGFYSNVSHLRIYSCKIYDDDTLVRDFIPVLDHDGVPCMYDKVSQTCFYNAGTGDFIAGPVIGE